MGDIVGHSGTGQQVWLGSLRCEQGAGGIDRGLALALLPQKTALAVVNTARAHSGPSAW